ncbi:MAG: DUF4326 domain-containing protein [Burkholderiales bacterium]
MTRVVHCKKEPYDVYIGRHHAGVPRKDWGVWGNPFALKSEADRARVLADYRAWLMDQPELLRKLHTLKGKKLGCWCHPKPCHGDVLAELADKI